MRNLEKDQALCVKVLKQHPAPWEWVENQFYGGYSGVVDADGHEVLYPNCQNDGDMGAAWFEDYPSEAVMKFMIDAVEGWPEAIRRATEAEKERQKLVKLYQELKQAVADRSVCDQTYTYGYRVGHLTGQIRLLEQILHIPVANNVVI